MATRRRRDASWQRGNEVEERGGMAVLSTKSLHRAAIWRRGAQEEKGEEPRHGGLERRLRAPEQEQRGVLDQLLYERARDLVAAGRSCGSCRDWKRVAAPGGEAKSVRDSMAGGERRHEEELDDLELLEEGVGDAAAGDEEELGDLVRLERGERVSRSVPLSWRGRERDEACRWREGSV